MSNFTLLTTLASALFAATTLLFYSLAKEGVRRYAELLEDLRILVNEQPRYNTEGVEHYAIRLLRALRRHTRPL
jgi:hypothetical protein